MHRNSRQPLFLQLATWLASIQLQHTVYKLNRQWLAVQFRNLPERSDRLFLTDPYSHRYSASWQELHAGAEIGCWSAQSCVPLDIGNILLFCQYSFMPFGYDTPQPHTHVEMPWIDNWLLPEWSPGQSLSKYRGETLQRDFYMYNGSVSGFPAEELQTILEQAEH